MNSIVTLVILAVLAAVVLYNLYAVLGRRVGRQPEDVDEQRRAQPASEPAEGDDLAPVGAEPAVALTGLAALRASDPAFDVGRFMAGARSAYEMIVTAYAEGDRETLEGLLSPQVLQAFEKAMAEREAQGVSETVEFLHPPRGDLETIKVDGDAARIKVRFLAEHRHRAKGPEGESVDDRRTAEIWTFERNLNSRDPNWILVRVEAAEA